MQSTLEFGGEERIDSPVTLDARETIKGSSADVDLEVRLPSFTPPAMPAMLFAVINDVKFNGIEDRKACAYPFLHAHGRYSLLFCSQHILPDRVDTP